MRRRISAGILFAIVLCPLGADVLYNYDRPFGWASPEIMAQGGSFMAITSGFNSLMTNPAGFAFNRKYKKVKRIENREERETTFQGTEMVTLQEADAAPERVSLKEKGEITVLGLLPWVTANPFALLNNASNFSNPVALIPFLTDQITKNGFGMGLQFGGGYVGHGFGFGFVGTVEGLFPRVNLLTTVTGDITATLALIGGYSYLFHLGPVDLAVGADMRPMWRVKVDDIDINSFFSIMGEGGLGSILNSATMLAGWGIGFDLGVLAKWEILTLGISLRDIAHTRYQYNGVDLTKGEITPFNGISYSGRKYISPMTMRIGLAVHPDFGKKVNKIVRTKAHLEWTIPLVNADEVYGFVAQSFLTNLHLGAEVKLFDIFALRGGLSSGYLTAGIGFDLFVAELNASIYSQEVGRQAGEAQQLGASMELVFRF